MPIWRNGQKELKTGSFVHLRLAALHLIGTFHSVAGHRKTGDCGRSSIELQTVDQTNRELRTWKEDWHRPGTFYASTRTAGLVAARLRVGAIKWLLVPEKPASQVCCIMETAYVAELHPQAKPRGLA